MYDEQIDRWASRLANCIMAHQWYDELEKIRREIREDARKESEGRGSSETTSGAEVRRDAGQPNPRKREEELWREFNTASLRDSECCPPPEDGLDDEDSEELLSLAGYDKED